MDNKVKDGNYIVIQSFMVKDLKLKGNELLIYAIIYGFSQCENQKYTGSIQYLADWTNSTKQSVINNLKSLVAKGYIGKNCNVINNVKFCEYYSKIFNGGSQNFNTGSQKSLMGGGKKSLPGGSQKSLPNNIDIDNIDIDNIDNNKENKKESVFEQEFEKLWSIYPKKQGKKKSLLAYIKARKSGTTYEAVEKGIKAYNQYIKSKKIESKYIKQGSTYFNQECWNDEYKVNTPDDEKSIYELLREQGYGYDEDEEYKI